jgi:transposase-like protein
MKNCKYCHSTNLVKNGIVKNKQHYKCKDCSKQTRIGDDRVKYDMDKKIKVIKCYLEGVGIRSIERLENVDNPLIIKWIRSFSKSVKCQLQNQKINDDVKNIEILELDELLSYCQKKLPKSIYGLLLIGTEIKLLTLNW